MASPPSPSLALAAAFKAWPRCIGSAWGPLALLVYLQILRQTSALDDAAWAPAAMFIAYLIVSPIAGMILVYAVFREAGFSPAAPKGAPRTAVLALFIVTQMLLLIPDWISDGAGGWLWAAYLKPLLAGASPPLTVAVIVVAAVAVGAFYISSRLTMAPFIVVARRRLDLRMAWRLSRPVLASLLLVSGAWLVWTHLPDLAGAWLESGWGGAVFALLTTAGVYPIALAYLVHLYLQIDPAAQVADAFD